MVHPHRVNRRGRELDERQWRHAASRHQESLHLDPRVMTVWIGSQRWLRHTQMRPLCAVGSLQTWQGKARIRLCVPRIPSTALTSRFARQAPGP